MGYNPPMMTSSSRLPAAHRAGIKRVILPERNRRDLDDVPQSALDDLEVIFATEMSEVLQAAIVWDSAPVDPNDPAASDPKNRGSRAVSTVFEPGSTAKVITMAAALEEGIATPLSQFVAPYQYTTSNDQTFKDSHEHPDQKLTLAGILVTSSNTGTIQVGIELVRVGVQRTVVVGDSPAVAVLVISGILAGDGR